MSDPVRAIQSAICQHLVQAGKITQQQADTLPVSENPAAIIPDIWRVCKDDEAVCQAIAKYLKKDFFVKVEEGVDLMLGEEGEQWIIYGDTIYLTNPFNRRQMSEPPHIPARRVPGQLALALSARAKSSS